MAKLKIGITCYPSIGGSGIIATELGNMLASMGHEIHFITYERPFKMDSSLDNVYFHHVEVNEYPVFKYPDYTLPLAVKMAEVSEKYKLDILHVHYAVPHATAAILARQVLKHRNKKSPKIITTLHGTDVTLVAADPNLRSIIKYSIDNSDGVTAVSNNLLLNTRKVLNTSKRVHVIHNFYNPKNPSASRDDIRKKLNVKDGDRLMIHLSNLRPVKRIGDLLLILSKLKTNLNIKLLILAGSDFYPFENQVKKLKIQNRVIVRENVQDIENYINASDIGLYTSEQESFGMGILETLSFGKPVVSSGVGGVPEVLKHGQNGLLFGVGNVNQAAKFIEKLAVNKDLRIAMGKKALASTERFLPEKIIGKYIKLYNELIG